MEDGACDSSQSLIPPCLRFMVVEATACPIPRTIRRMDIEYTTRESEPDLSRCCYLSYILPLHCGIGKAQIDATGRSMHWPSSSQQPTQQLQITVSLRQSAQTLARSGHPKSVEYVEQKGSRLPVIEFPNIQRFSAISQTCYSCEFTMNYCPPLAHSDVPVPDNNPRSVGNVPDSPLFVKSSLYNR